MKTTLISILLLCGVLLQAQVYQGNLTLATQAEVNAFSYQQVTGNLEIGVFAGESDIINLAPLTKLVTVGGSLCIYYNDLLTSLSGLNNLTSVANLRIYSNTILTSLSGLDNLTNLEYHIEILNNASLTDLFGLEKITSVPGTLDIAGNDALTNISGLLNITSVGWDLRVQSNAVLASLSGLKSLNSVRDLYISYNDALTNLSGFENLTTVRDVEINNNDALTSLSGFKILTTVGGSLTIKGNPLITNLFGLENIISIGKNLTISDNALFTNLSGLENLNSLGGSLFLDNNATLPNLSGIEHIISVLGEGLYIRFNTALPSLAGLENLTILRGSLAIQGNPLITGLSELENLTSIGGYLYIMENALLTNLSGLNNLTSLEGGLYVVGNPLITDLSGLDIHTSVGGLFIEENLLLISLSGLENITSIGYGGISIKNNAILPNLAGLENITTLNGGLIIQSNPLFTSLSVLENITSIGRGGISIKNNAILPNLAGLENITTLDGGLIIQSNPLITNLSGLDNLTSVEYYLTISNNDVLSEFCAIYGLINGGGLTGVVYNVSFNAVNPTKQEIIDNGPCSSNTPPVAVCQNVTVAADKNCQAMVTAAEVNNGSTDPEGNEISLSISPEGPYNLGVTNVTLTVDDGNGETATCEATVTVYDDILPLITCPAEIHENSAPGYCGTLVNFTVTASDNCEGIVTVVSIPSSGSTFPVGTTTVTSTASDAAGNKSSCSFDVTVTDNIAPTVVTHDLTVQLDENGFANIVPADINNGSSDNCAIESYKLDIMDFDCADIATNPIEVTLTVTDINGNSASNTANVTVKDEIAPVVETQDIIVQLDKNGLASIVPADIDNGSNDACGIASLSVIPNAFTCANVGNNTVTLIATDVNGNSDSKAANVTVRNDSPVIYAVTTSSLDPMQLGTPATITVNFTDDNATEVNIQWGDLLEDDYTTSTGVVNATHNYLLPGVYIVTVTVTDPCGEMTMYYYQYIVIYDPTAGFVTGGGWIFSTEGAYKPDPLLTGKASFGFVSKYKKGSSVPDGNTEFQFNAGNLNFNSTDYEWLVIAGSKAKFKGSGTINGFGNYGFLLSAIDADLTPSAIIDKFRIKIWDKDNGDVVVYDNNMEVDDNADPTTEIGGGSIIIHTSKTKSAEIESDILLFGEASSLLVYPNPFSDRLQFEFVSPVDGHARIDLFDFSGRILQTVFYSPVAGGVHYNAEFIPASENSGIIYYRMTLGMEVFTGKVVFNK